MPRYCALGLLVLATIGAPSTAAGQAEDTAAKWKLSGSFLNLFTSSRTFLPPLQGFVFDVNRLRLRLEGEPFSSISLDAQYDNELLLGDYIRTPQYALIAERPSLTGPTLERDYARGTKFIARHRLYRGVVGWAGSSTDVKVGRQRIALGTGLFWSPLDILLTPIDAVRLEREYRSGINALLIEQKLGALAKLDGIYSPSTAGVRSVAAVYMHGNVRGTDLSVLGGTFRGDDAIGADFAGSVGGWGLRGEATATRAAIGLDYIRALMGADYAFPNTLTMSLEAYFNGQGASDPARYDLRGLFSGRVLNVARAYAGAFLSYEVTPLLKLTGYGVLNLNDGGNVLWPRMEYSVRANLIVAGGLQRFGGSAKTEYGRLNNVLHFEARWFF